MNDESKKAMFAQLVAQIQRDSITNFDDIQNYVSMYMIEYKRQMKHTSKPEVRYFERKEIKDKIYQPFKFKVGNQVIKIIKENDVVYYNVYDLVTKLATTDHAFAPSTLTRDIDDIASDEVVTFKTSNHNAVRYITSKGVEKTNNLMQYRNYKELINGF